MVIPETVKVRVELLTWPRARLNQWVTTRRAPEIDIPFQHTVHGSEVVSGEEQGFVSPKHGQGRNAPRDHKSVCGPCT
jgi:hypothetical protein